MTAEEDQAYERGRKEGEIRERLIAHDRRFEAINGQLAKIATTLGEMTLVVSRVADKQQAIIDTTTATREALRSAAERRWSRWQKLFTVLGVAAAVVGAYVAWRSLR